MKHQPKTFREGFLLKSFCRNIYLSDERVTNTFIILFIRNKFPGPDDKKVKVPAFRVTEREVESRECIYSLLGPEIFQILLSGAMNVSR